MFRDHKMNFQQFRSMLRFITTMTFLHVSFSIKVEKFYSSELCDFEERIKNNCSALVAENISLNKCVFKCSLNSTCIGASVTGQGKCYHYFTCNAISWCSIKNETHRYKSKNCAHGGVWNPRTSTCSCVRGWIGENCLDLPSACQDLKSHGYPSPIRTHLTLMPSPSADPVKPTPVYCTLKSKVRSLSHFGKIDFNRTWAEYKEGFFVDKKNFWIGLDHWHALSSAGYTSLTVYISFAATILEYKNFKVQNESRNFSFTFDNLKKLDRPSFLENTSFGDCFGPQKTKPFSTKDKGDANEDNGNCASKIGSGWWYEADKCTETVCNIFGKPPRDWNDTQVYQRLRIDGLDPGLMQKYESNAGVLMYLDKP